MFGACDFVWIHSTPCKGTKVDVEHIEKLNKGNFRFRDLCCCLFLHMEEKRHYSDSFAGRAFHATTYDRFLSL